jgi:hypothetical protein
MSYKIRIGGYSLKAIDSVTVVKSIGNLSDTATVVLPGTYINRAFGTPGKRFEDLVHEGDGIEIWLGYNDSPVQEFKGYINAVSTDDAAITLDCMDGLYLFKKTLKDAELKGVTLRKLLEGVAGEINALNASAGTATHYRVECDYEFGYEKFVIFKATGVHVLQKVQDETKANIYFTGDTLHVHPPYGHIVNEKPVIYDFARNVETSELKYVRLTDKKIEVEVSAVHPDGSVVTAVYGTPGGEKRQRTVKAAGKTDLKTLAENEYNIWAYDGFEGSFTGWLIPYVEPACKIELRDAEYPQKNGVYYVTATEVSFGSSGGKRKVTLGRRLG